MSEKLKSPIYKTLLEMKELAVRPVPGIILDTIAIEESEYQRMLEQSLLTGY